MELLTLGASVTTFASAEVVSMSFRLNDVGPCWAAPVGAVCSETSPFAATVCICQ